MLRRNNITVVIPTYMRVSSLKKCIDTILKQTILPQKIFCICREDDETTIDFLKKNYTNYLQEKLLEIYTVKEAGHIPPIQKAIDVCTTEYIAFIDDDAIPREDWVERILKGYTNKNIGGYGGRVINHPRTEYYIRKVKSLGKINWYGKITGNLFDELICPKAIEVDFLNEGNMSFRRSALEKVKIDMILNYGSAKGYGIDLCLSLKALGYKIVYDPELIVDHYPAPRKISVNRGRTKDNFYEYSRNLTYIMLKHMSSIKKVFFLIYFFFVGQKISLGLITSIYLLFLREKDIWGKILYSFKGKREGIKLYINYALKAQRR